MRFILISDSHDALTGMRLAGVEGVLAETAEQAEAEIKKCIEDETVGIILITESLASACSQTLDELKLGRSRPLVVTVPGSKDDKCSDDVMHYVHEAIGIKI